MNLRSRLVPDKIVGSDGFWKHNLQFEILMTNNPYASPAKQGRQIDPHAKSQVAGPAISLIVVCIISLLLVSLGLLLDVWLIASGTADRMVQPSGMDKITQLMIRMIWSFLLLITNGVVLAASIRMFSMKSYGFAKTGAIISVIPCLGPCCILGIPFGIWALVVLAKPNVANAFRS